MDFLFTNLYAYNANATTELISSAFPIIQSKKQTLLRVNLPTLPQDDLNNTTETTFPLQHLWRRSSMVKIHLLFIRLILLCFLSPRIVGEEGRLQCLLKFFFFFLEVIICYMAVTKLCHLREIAIPFQNKVSHQLHWHCQALLQDFLMASGYGIGIQSIGARKQLL